MRVSRSQLSVLVLLAVGLLGLLLVVPAPREADAYVGDPVAPPVPMVHAGAATAAGAFTTLGVVGTLQASAGACATGVGCVVVATGAVAGAGFATGYYGASALCAGASFLMAPDGSRDACNPWEPVEAEPGGFETTGFVPCSTFGAPGNQCVKVSWDELADKGHGSQRFALELRDSADARHSWQVNGSGDLGGCGLSSFGASYSNHVIMAGPTSGGALCTYKGSTPTHKAASAAPYSDGWTIASTLCTGTVPGFRNCGVRPGDIFVVRGLSSSWYTGGPWDSSWSYSGVHSDLYAVADVDPAINARGEELRYRTVAVCWTGPGTETTVTATGAWAFESDDDIEVPGNPCPTGSTVKGFDIDVARPTRTGGVEWANKYSWDAPSEWTTTTWPHRDCVVVGAECKVERVEVTPELDQCEWGGVVVLMSYCEEPQPQVVPRTEILENPEPEDPPAPTTTTTVVGAPPTTAPPDTSVPSSEPPPPPAGPGGGDNQWSTCMESQIGDDWSEVTFNPVTWVRAIIYYVTAPIICALWWLVVPAGGLDSLWDLFLEPLEDSELIASLRVFVDEWEWNGGCAPVNFGDPLGDVGPSLGAIDVGMCGNLVIALVWTVLLGLAVLGMAGRLVRTLWTFGQYEQAGYL
jgi:hypothetical protein